MSISECLYKNMIQSLYLLFGHVISPHRFVPPKGLMRFYPEEKLTLNLPGGGGYGLKEERDSKLIVRDNELSYNN